jgi:5,10-methylenetetrahydromethanopterin reductase
VRLEFGLGLRGDTGDVERIARLAETSGFDVLTAFNDLGFGPPLPVLLAAAAVTERVRLGPSCLNPYTMRPDEIASQIVALDRASRGRAYVGLAKGAWLETIGVAQPHPVRTLRDTAAAVGQQLRRQLSRKVTLLIGAWGPRTVALAGEIADELKVGGSANPDLVPVMRERLGRGSATRIVMGAVTVVDEDRRAARERARKAVAMYFDAVARHDPTLEDATVLTDGLLDRFAFAGTPVDVARQARALFDAGASRVEFGVPFGLKTPAGVELLARKVLPEFF